jgi:Fic family protein
MRYVWQHERWPLLTWDAQTLVKPLSDARFKQGALLGQMSQLGFELQTDAHVQSVTEEVIKSSEIEGEVLDWESVRSSVARRLGLPEAGLSKDVDRKTDAVVEMMLDATTRYDVPLTARRLQRWQAALFPQGFSSIHPVKVGGWRDDHEGPMQVVSGPVGREHVHYEAPPAERLDLEMESFLAWFGAPGPNLDGLVRTALAHFWFVTIHPFDDGNGRIARAVADMALAQLERTPRRFYSVSSQLRRERRDYYDVLERTQQGSLDITGWIEWFLGCYGRAVESAQDTSRRVLQVAAFWQHHAAASFNERQKKVLNLLLSTTYEGHLTARKWAAHAKVSVDTAQRDINDLVARGVLLKNPGGSKNTSYGLRDVQPVAVARGPGAP